MAGVSVLFPTHPSRPHELAPYAELVQRGSAERLWVGQTLTLEVYPLLAYLAGMGHHVPVGIGVSMIPFRHPYAAALEARSLAALTRCPVVVGFGVGPPELAGALVRRPYRSPRSAAVEYASQVRALLHGHPPPSREHFALALRLPPMGHPPVEVGLGVLRPRMAESAGGVVDVAVTWMTPRRYVKDALRPALAKGVAKGAGGPRIVAVVPVAVSRPRRDPRKLALLAAGSHLRGEHYTDMLRRAGVPVDRANPVATATALVDHRVFAYGDASAVAGEVAAYGDAGVDEVVLNPAGVHAAEGPDGALEDLRDIVAAVGALADRSRRGTGVPRQGEP